MLHLLVALAKARRGVVDAIWNKFAFLAKEAHQQMSEMRAMTVPDLTRLCEEISALAK